MVSYLNICSICHCLEYIGIFCLPKTEISVFFERNNLRLGDSFPVLDFRGTHLRPLLIRCSTITGVKKIMIEGTGILCRQLTSFRLRDCDPKVST